MKAMCPEKIILRGTLPGEIDETETVFTRSYREDFSWIKKGLASGFYHANTVIVKDTPRYVVIWHKNDQDCMVVNAASQLNGGGSISALIDACKHIARTTKCVAIEVLTVRAGLVKELCKNGFQTAGVALVCAV